MIHVVVTVSVPTMWITGRHTVRASATVVRNRTYFNRKLLVTTVTLESAMAADASIGESRPSAATGMPITL